MLRIDVGDDRAGADRRAVVQHDARGAVALDDDFAHRSAHVDAHAMGTGGACHRLRDGAHAADGVAPHALLAVHFAEDVMQQHVSGARRVRARQIADHRIEAEHGFDRIGLEPAIEHVAGRFAQEAKRRRGGIVSP